jgi:peptidoglycan-N-acetylmuramic acid deacetylase
MYRNLKNLCFFSLVIIICFVSACGLKLDDAVVIYSPADSKAAEATPHASEPTAVPMLQPTAEPSQEPTAEPNQEPTAEPTAEPLPESTSESTAEPTSEPTAEATDEPGDYFDPNEIIWGPELVTETLDIEKLPNDTVSWYINQNNIHEPPGAQQAIDLSRYSSFYLGDTSQKIVYLTFDIGYEQGFSGQILDTLKEKGVQAAFFMSEHYIATMPDILARIVAEGHVPANHGAKHKAIPTLSEEELAAEINDNARLFAETTGYPMDPFFRPPEGAYSERSLAMVQQMGYTTVFWSFAHVDWDVNNQPSAAEAHDRVMNRLHNGMVILLHGVSEANANALASIIDDVKAEGYEFGSLHDLRD